MASKLVLLNFSLLFSFLILIVFFSVKIQISKPQDNSNIPKGLHISGHRFRISERELPQKIINALNGDPELAEAVRFHYSQWIHDHVEAFKWDHIGAENGSFELRRRLASILLEYNIDVLQIFQNPTMSDIEVETKTRGIFWLYTLVKNNYKLESTIPWLNRHGFTLETASPPSDDLFPNEYIHLTEIEISNCKTGALQGNRKAALLLGKYYSEVEIDKELSEYWFRIGAQNGSPECMYYLGQIMLIKDDELKQVRGRFWIEQAAHNGYRE